MTQSGFDRSSRRVIDATDSAEAPSLFSTLVPSVSRGTDHQSPRAAISASGRIARAPGSVDYVVPLGLTSLVFETLDDGGVAAASSGISRTSSTPDQATADD